MQELTRNELIRVLATVRTDLNRDVLVVMAAPGQMGDGFLTNHGEDIETRQACALAALRTGVECLDQIIDILNRAAQEV